MESRGDAGAGPERRSHDTGPPLSKSDAACGGALRGLFGDGRLREGPAPRLVGSKSTPAILARRRPRPPPSPGRLSGERTLRRRALHERWCGPTQRRRTRALPDLRSPGGASGSPLLSTTALPSCSTPASRPGWLSTLRRRRRGIAPFVHHKSVKDGLPSCQRGASEVQTRSARSALGGNGER